MKVFLGESWCVLGWGMGGWCYVSGSGAERFRTHFPTPLLLKTCSDGVVPENIHTPPVEGTFALAPHPSGTSIPGGACHTPIPSFFNLIGYPVERIFVSKMLLHYIILRTSFFLR